MVSLLRAKVIGVLAATFALGALSGSGAMYAYAQHQQAKQLTEEKIEWRDGRFVAALTRELDLDASQQQKVATINDSNRSKRRELSRDMFERCGEHIKEHQAQVEGEIRAVLTPAQQTRYDALLRERRDKGPGPGFGPPR